MYKGFSKFRYMYKGFSKFMKGRQAVTGWVQCE